VNEEMGWLGALLLRSEPREASCYIMLMLFNSMVLLFVLDCGSYTVTVL
jgi:hypothetical protein